jgi:hypothetical protein
MPAAPDFQDLAVSLERPGLFANSTRDGPGDVSLTRLASYIVHGHG